MKRREGKKSLLLHIVVWLAVWLIISFWAGKGNRLGEYLLKNIAVLLPTLVLVYLNWFWLFPMYFTKRKYVLFSSLSLLSLYLVFYLGEMFIVEWMDLILPTRPKKQLGFDPYAIPTSFWRILNGAAPYTLGLFSSTIFLAIRLKNQNEKETAALRLENAQNKIRYLQSQISPHFLFNSLNNVHSLMLQDNKLASDYIIKLSDLLRFMIYETDKEFITLGEEIDLLKKYMTLVDFRVGTTALSNNLKIDIKNHKLSIPPLLIFGVLENGVKHSGMGVEKDFLFNMTIQENQHLLTVKLTNSISTQKFDKKKKGFGIESLKKRLAVHYPSTHTFDFEKVDNTAKTHLTLNLDFVN